MKKYTYKFCVFTNNCNAGVMFLKAFNRLIDALNYKEYYQHYLGRGCCDVVRKRCGIDSATPITPGIYNNYKYNEYDLI